MLATRSVRVGFFDVAGLVGPLPEHGVRKLLDAVGAIDQAVAGRLDRGLEFDYARPGEKPDCRWREKAERERILSRVAEDAERERADGLLSDERVADAHRLLRELVGQDFDVDDDGVPRLYRGTRAARSISTVDTEMRHGRKSQHQRFDGYKLSAAATNTPEPLITAVEVAPASEQDGPQAKGLIDAQPDRRRPQRVLGDTGYGTGPVRAELADRGVDVLASVPEAPGRPGRLVKRDFQIDLTAGTVTCPAGQTAVIRTEPSGQRRATFAKTVCAGCPLRERCVAPASGARQVLIVPGEGLCSPPAKRSTIPRRPSTCAAPGRGSSGYSACSPSATAPARAATSAAPKSGYWSPGPPHWSI